MQINVSAGTAYSLGLWHGSCAVAPTTAYLMLGGRCRQDCAFCTQARSSTATAEKLSRVSWPLYDIDETFALLASTYDKGKVYRACFQVTVHREYFTRTLETVERLHRLTPIPISVSVSVRNVSQVGRLLDAGAARVGLALDAATRDIYQICKSANAQASNFDKTLNLIENAAREYAGHISTHLIVGLGETEEEMARRIQQMYDWNITVGLFAFTPVRGTRLQHEPPPPLAQYRRVQAAHYLIKHRYARVDDFTFNAGQIANYGLPREKVTQILANGHAFETSGCEWCNRPYYNERPGGDMYNYPRPLSAEETRAAQRLISADWNKFKASL